ncbi:hypothetical protein K1719_009292 [Acacia pycnantha]|nr:hypothetical protein K1719_009292 [Acacia pycnantha]
MSKLRQVFAGISDPSNNKRSKKLFLALFSTLLLLAVVVGIVAGVNSRQNPPPGFTEKISSHRDVIELSLNITIRAVEHNLFNIEELNDKRKGSLTEREKTALHDCLETIDETLDELHTAYQDLKIYPNKKTLYQHADDLKTLISAAITNQVTCLDGFFYDGADKKVRGALEAGQVHVEHMCSNALAMIKNMTDTDVANYEMKMGITKRRRLMAAAAAAAEDGVQWPEWMAAADRHLLQATQVKADVVVAADGSGNFKTVSEAVRAAPEKSSKRYVIRIKAGVYKENVEVLKKKTNIMFLGDGRKNTIITGSRNVVDGSTTFHSATVAVVGEGFLARDITFENTAGHAKHQAVALRVGSDFAAFYQCDFLGYQDTLYVHHNRQFFISCLITGTVDFIFGNSAALFQDCDIHARLPGSGQKNMVTAQGRVDPNQNTGIVIQKCRIGATSDLEAQKKDFKTYLGRPWKEYSRTVIMQSTISDVIDPVGWHEWNGDFALNTLFYGEYQNSGAGAGTANRVKWKGYKVITSASEAQQFTAASFIGGSNWLGSTGFPVSLGL